MRTADEDLLCLAQSWADLAGSTLHFRAKTTPADIVVNRHAGLLAAAFELFDLVVSTPEGLAAAQAMGFLPADAEPVQQSGLADVAHDAGHPPEHEGRDGGERLQDAIAQGFLARLLGKLVRKKPAFQGGREAQKAGDASIVLYGFAGKKCSSGHPCIYQFHGSQPVVSRGLIVRREQPEIGGTHA